MSETVFPYTMLSGSAGNKKWVSATAVPDFGDSQALVPPAGRPTGGAIEVGAVRLTNRAGAPALVGLAVRYGNSSWVAGQVTSTGAYSDDTVDAQSHLPGDFPLWQHLITTGNGFIVGASERFNTLGIIESVAGDQTGAVLALAYWNGTAWIDETAALLNTDALLGAGTGEKLLTWMIAPGWVPGGSGVGVPQSTYNIRVTHTVGAAGTTDPQASQLYVGMAQFVTTAVANLTAASFVYVAGVRFPRSGVALHGLFSVASLANQVEAQWRYY